jgi:hypothetical protein
MRADVVDIQHELLQVAAPAQAAQAAPEILPASGICLPFPKTLVFRMVYAGWQRGNNNLWKIFEDYTLRVLKEFTCRGINPATKTYHRVFIKVIVGNPVGSRTFALVG